MRKFCVLLALMFTSIANAEIILFEVPFQKSHWKIYALGDISLDFFADYEDSKYKGGVSFTCDKDEKLGNIVVGFDGTNDLPITSDVEIFIDEKFYKKVKPFNFKQLEYVVTFELDRKLNLKKELLGKDSVGFKFTTAKGSQELSMHLIYYEDAYQEFVDICESFALAQ